MTTLASQFSAAPSAAGYLYQARLALALCLRHVNGDLGVEVGVERLDDVSFEKDGTPLELLQAKHHIDRIASLTDKSADIWKTLRIWSEAAAKDPSLPARTRLVLVTTGKAPDGSAAALLRAPSTYPSGQKRNPKLAASQLESVATQGGNEELAAAHAAFLKLTEGMRASLLSAIEILDQADLITDLSETIEEGLRIFAPRGQATKAREMLEGWWWGRICRALLQKPPEAIAITEIETKLDDIRDQLKRDVLVADQEDVEPPTSDIASYEGRPFVRQLNAVGVTGARVEFAKRDFYLAFTQRSKWARDSLLVDGEISKFETRLVQEWQPHFERMTNKLIDGSDDDLRRAGEEIYYWVETSARFPFRSGTHRFLTVGSYHMLANDLRVGWHRDYTKICNGEES